MENNPVNKNDDRRRRKSRRGSGERSTQTPEGRSASGHGNGPGNGSRSRSRRSSSGKSSGSGKSNYSTVFLWLGRLIVFVMICGAPWWYGSVSQTAQCCLLALGVSGLAMWWFSMALGNRTRHLFPYLAFPVILGLILVGIQLIPLGSTLGQAVAPRQTELYEKYASAVESELLEKEESPSTSPVRITMDADGTSRMFNLLMLGLIGLMLGCHFFCSRRAIYYLPFLMTINGFAISCFGIIQKIQSETTIYGVEPSQGGVPFGPFVNRNNAAGYLLICMAGALALLYGVFNRAPTPGQRPRTIVTGDYPILQRMWLNAGLFLAEFNAAKFAALLATIVIACGIVATFSRSGILALGTGLVITTWYFCFTRKSGGVVLALGATAVLVAGLIAYAGFGDRLTSRFDQLSDVELLTNDRRVSHWIQTSPAIGEFSPLGSGVGSYLNVHRLYRLDSEERVFFFAENQYFQTLVEAGLPGLLLLLSAIILLGLCIRFIMIRGNSPKTTALCIFGVFLLPTQAMVATFDFGLFIPSNMVLMAVVCGFLAGQAHALADRLKKKYIFRFTLPRSLTMLLLLAMFTAALFSLIASSRYASTERAMKTSPHTENYLSMDLRTTDNRIEDLRTRLASQADAAALRRLAELYIYRYRIRLFHALRGQNTDIDTTNSQVLDRLWLQTGVLHLHELVYQGWQSGNRNRVHSLIGDELVRENLLPAIHYLKLSRSKSPLQPAVHLMLGQLHAVSPIRDVDQYHMQRSLELAPANSATAFICGLLNLQANRHDAAVANFSKCMQILPSNYNRVVQVTVPVLPAERIVNDILPEDPFLLHNFATTYLTLESAESLKLHVFQRVANLLDKEIRGDRKSLQVKVEVQKELNDLPGAIRSAQTLVDDYPETARFRHELALLLLDNGQLDEAYREARELESREKGKPNYVNYQILVQKIRKLREERDFSPK